MIRILTWSCYHTSRLQGCLLIWFYKTLLWNVVGSAWDAQTPEDWSLHIAYLFWHLAVKYGNNTHSTIPDHDTIFYWILLRYRNWFVCAEKQNNIYWEFTYFLVCRQSLGCISKVTARTLAPPLRVLSVNNTEVAGVRELMSTRKITERVRCLFYFVQLSYTNYVSDDIVSVQQSASSFTWMIFLKWHVQENVTNENREVSQLALAC